MLDLPDLCLQFKYETGRVAIESNSRHIYGTVINTEDQGVV